MMGNHQKLKSNEFDQVKRSCAKYLPRVSHRLKKQMSRRAKRKANENRNDSGNLDGVQDT